MASVSVLLPFLNPGHKLGRAIESIIKQTFLDWELILINNGSDDESLEIAMKFCDQNDRIKLITETEKGIVPALNKGLQHCQSPYIARMDADDISLPGRLELQYKFLETNSHIHLCAGRVKHISDNKSKTDGYQYYIDWINSLLTHSQIFKYRFLESPIAHPSVMFRSSCISDWGGYRNGDFPEDYELWLRWLERGAIMAKIPEFILLWDDTPTRLSRTDLRYSTEAFFQTKLTYIDNWLRKHNPYYPEIVIWGAGKVARKKAGKLQEMGYKILFYIDIDPRKARRSDCEMYTEINKPGKFFILSLTGSRGAFSYIEEYLTELGFVNGRDFLLAAGF